MFSELLQLDVCYNHALLDIFFFFQAEDGIRDYKVTGVQTCALPIYPVAPRRVFGTLESPRLLPTQARSEERRVGKEGRSRRSTSRSTKKTRQQSKPKITQTKLTST